MKYLVLGSDSFIGSRMVESLLHQGKDVIAASRSNKKLFASYYKIDVSKNQPSFEILEKVDVIIYCIGAGIQKHENASTVDIFNLNYFKVIELIDRLKDSKFSGSFVTFGSYFEIGKDFNSKAYNEKQITNVVNANFNDYSLSKRNLTNFIENRLEQKDQGFSLLHLILPNVYGFGENGNRLLPYLADSLLNRQKMKLSSGDQVRQFLHVNDVVDMSVKLIENCKNGIYNLGGEVIVSVRSMVEEMIAIAKDNYDIQNPNIDYCSTTGGDQSMNYLALDYSKFSREFPDYPFRRLRDCLVEYFEK